MNCRTPLVSNTFGTNVVSTFAYAYDELSRRTQRLDTTDSALTTNTFSYNVRSELIDATMGTNTYSYAYDPIGNRQQTVENGLTNHYTANALNQYTAIAPDTPALAYDPDGNMTRNGDWTYIWDAENRLVEARPATTNLGSSLVQYMYDAQSRRIARREFVWSDYLGDTTWHYVQGRAYLYDGWNLLQERKPALTPRTPHLYIPQTNLFLTGVSGPVAAAYLWGLDLSQTLQGAGGIGGLLQSRSSATNAFTFCDANGNITDLVDTNGAVVAHYEYDPYGNTIAQSGDQADANPFRFSTKYWDGETGFYYYGYRFYSPQLGRWLSKDPLIENAYERYIRLFSPEVANFMLRLLLTGSDESNTYSAFGNDAVGAVDHLGWASRRGGGGGPWHPPDGVHMKCDKGDTCAEIEAKMTLLAKAISSHTGWECLAPERHRNPGHWEEIDNLWTAYADCSTLWYMKNCPGSPPLVPAVAPKKCEKVNLCIDGSCQTTVVAVGATAVACAIGYGVYKVLKTCVTTGVGAVLGGPPGAVGGFCLGLSPVGG